VKAGKAGSEAKRSVRVSCTAAKSTKSNGGTTAADAYPQPFAHRTPTQLHASTYAVKGG